jgi:hypothetical protein
MKDDPDGTFGIDEERKPEVDGQIGSKAASESFKFSVAIFQSCYMMGRAA